ncbi:HD domain-containing protein [Cryobacterium suzukii]|uniref:HD domain-containing protein n=1 Tax=Cryobacterium suzukii TaxID=1259198 RepID=A0A4R9AEX3_9MICO|nr:HD domain-containing protein [Cryobacterium suzukii]
MQFGPDAAFPSWASVTDYLLSDAKPSQLHDAITLARTAHAGQVDKLGAPYIYHPLAVMQRVRGTDAKIVAVLHDVVEDTEVTLDDLRCRGFSEEIVEAVDAVTKVKGASLAESMARVKASPLALVVKKADISHNADPYRSAQLSKETRKRLERKYQESARLLDTTLGKILRAHKR